MQHDQHDGLPGGTPSVPTALVVDDSFAARARVITLLHLGGWRVRQAVGTDDALRLAALIGPDLVVTEMVMRNGHGATLMRRLREQGSTARFLVVAARRTQQCRALASASGALACLAKPVDPRLFVDVLHGLTAAVAAPVREQPTPLAVLETATGFLTTMPHRLSAIAVSAQAGDPAGVATAAEALAVASDRLGHAEIAFLSNSVARDARRGTVSHGRLVALVELCARLDSALSAQAA
jgi:DNA-binding response OmpR family regulator